MAKFIDWSRGVPKTVPRKLHGERFQGPDKSKALVLDTAELKRVQAQRWTVNLGAAACDRVNVRVMDKALTRSNDYGIKGRYPLSK